MSTNNITGGSSAKRFVTISFIYAMAAIAGGVFFREFTKFNGFTGKTQLSFVHTHLFILGMMLFLVLALFEKVFQISNGKKFKLFFRTYNTGVVFAAIMFLWHGIYQVYGIDGGALISGIAGLAHIILTLGFIFLFLLLRERCTESGKK